MRRFHSYGPVNARSHFSVPRTDLVNFCLNSLINSDDEGWHYFTIWAPRQTGKTWLMQEVRGRIQSMYPEQFIVGMMSMQELSFITDDAVFMCHLAIEKALKGLSLEKCGTSLLRAITFFIC